MCRMMGVVSQGPVYYDLFEEFADLATQGMCPLGAPDERGHKDGWGLVCFRNGELAVQMKDVGSAADSSKYYGTAWKIAKLNLERAAGQSLIVLGHLRRASSQDRIAQKWSHPFLQERDQVVWAFQHNGSLKGEMNDPERVDSQVLFEMLLANLDGGDHASVAKAIGATRRQVLEEFGGFTALNLMLSDGSALHTYRDFESNGGYYTLYEDHFGELVITASEPILAMKADPMPRGIVHTITPDLEIQRTEVA